MPQTLQSIPRPARAAIVGASGGIGAALAHALSGTFDTVHALSRRSSEAFAGLVPGTIDLLDEASIATASETLRGPIPLRLVIVATGVLQDNVTQPEKSMRALDPTRLAHAFAVNTIGPALIAKHLISLLPREGKAVFAVLSARVGSIGDNRLGGWYGYRASKAALNQVVRTLAVEVGRTRPEAIILALHPGTVATGLSEPFRANVSAERLLSPSDSARHLLEVIDAARPDDSGGFLAWDGQPIPY